MKKVLIAALIAGFSLSATAAETIRFATEASYPPFESIDANNQIVGFDVDLAQALCKEIDATCTFSNQAFDSLIPSLKFRRVEAVMAGGSSNSSTCGSIINARAIATRCC